MKDNAIHSKFNYKACFVKCALCGSECGSIERWRYKCENGVHVVTAEFYCVDCNENRHDELERHFETAWQKDELECKAKAEQNWQEHGIYTNVGGTDGPSEYFGFKKAADGSFYPYPCERRQRESSWCPSELVNLLDDYFKSHPHLTTDDLKAEAQQIIEGFQHESMTPERIKHITQLACEFIDDVKSSDDD